jgi:uncharacterized protein
MQLVDFWSKTSGTWINVFAIIFGTGCGLLLQGKLPPAMQQVITQAVGLIILFIGFTMAGSLLEVKTAIGIDGTVIALVALVVGGILGEWWQIETKMNAIAELLKSQLKQWLNQFLGNGSRFSEGFVSASLLFCIGPMAILGSLNNGLLGDRTILSLKSLLDGITSVAFASSLGIGVGFSALPLLLYQGSLSLLAGILAQGLHNPAQEMPVILTTGVGGILLLGLGLNLLEIGKIAIASFLPSLLLAPLGWWLISLI